MEFDALSKQDYESRNQTGRRHERHGISIVHNPVHEALEPPRQISVAYPWRAEGIAGRQSLCVQISGGDHGQRAAQRMASDIKRQVFDFFAVQAALDFTFGRFKRIVKSCAHIPKDVFPLFQIRDGG